MPSTTTVSPTKERLRTSALDLIADRGMAALSVRSLCRAVGIRESSFYAHFPSKEALLEDLLERAGAEAPLRIAERLAARCLPLRGLVEQLVAELTMLWTEPQD
ncbi:MAG: TetR/AcrR family transcriptional regulator [Gemmatimonas sp.]